MSFGLLGGDGGSVRSPLRWVADVGAVGMCSSQSLECRGCNGWGDRREKGALGGEKVRGWDGRVNP